MKPLIPHLLVLAVLCAQGSGSLAQGIYVKQGPNGPVFSDQPLPGAREVQLKPLNVMSAPPIEAKSPATPTAEAVPVESAGLPANALPPYDRFEIVSPENDGSTVANTAVFEVRLAVSPPLHLAGQHASYVVARLTAFHDGLVLGHGDYANSVMAGVAKNLTSEEIQALATYVEGLHPAASDAKTDTSAQTAQH